MPVLLVKFLGSEIVYDFATEPVHINISQAILVLGGTMDYLVNSVFNYLTLSEAYKVTAQESRIQMLC
jgi:NAD(P) transhydrogenase